MEGVAIIPLTVVLLSGLAAGVTDIWKFKVHNALTLPLFLSGVLFHGLLQGSVQGSQGWAFSLYGALFGFAILLVPYVLGGMGAGDVKLMAGMGAWLGMPWIFYVFVASGIAGGLYAVALLLRQPGQLRDVWTRFQIMYMQSAALARQLGPDERIEAAVKQSDRRRRLVPFAAMVVVGVVAVLVFHWWTVTGA